MAGYSSYGNDNEETVELDRTRVEISKDPDNYEIWEKLVRTAEGLEGGLTRNSSPQSIAKMRETYDSFLAKFPLFFGYWKKYADLEFSIAGTEAAELVYERGIAGITNSVDLWAQYCAFKVETSHDPDIIRELFERGANCVGYDFLAHPFWDKYLEFEERHEAHDKIFALLQRIISIPMHQYARYFERFRLMTTTRGPEEGIPADKLAELQAEVTATIGPVARSQNDIAQALRSRIEAYQYEIFQKCQGETGARWTYEQEVKRPYFHVTELDEGQLSNWRKYLDFEEAQGDYKRIVFLYERCCVAAAYYDEFWLRYARWMARQDGKVEETRNIYQRSSCIFAPIARRTVRMQWALFEEMNGRVQVALDIYQAMLLAVPGVVEVINAWANCARRQRSMDAALQVYTSQIESEDLDRNTKAALIAESARMAWKVDGDAARARQLFRDNQGYYPNSFAFWSGFLTFELEQPSTQSTEHVQHTRIKEVFKSVRMSSLPTESIQALAQVYMVYLLERGTKDVAKEYMQLDAEINGSQVAKLTIAGKDVFMSG